MIKMYFKPFEVILDHVFLGECAVCTKTILVPTIDRKSSRKGHDFCAQSLTNINIKADSGLVSRQ